MLLVQDQYGQSYRKNFDSELLLKQETKPFFSESNEVWGIESNGEEEVATSVNDSGEDDVYAEPREEFLDSVQTRKKNVRFGGDSFNFGLETSEASSVENEYAGFSRGFLKAETRRILNEEPESVNHKVKEYLRVPYKPKCRTMECGYGRPKSSPEKGGNHLGDFERRSFTMGDYEPRRSKIKDHCCTRPYHGEFDFDEYTCRKSLPRSYRFQYGDDSTMCCDHCPNNDGRKLENKSFVKMKPMPTPSHKHKCQMSKATEHDTKPHRMVRLPQEIHYDSQTHLPGDRYNEYCDVTFGMKNKKKVLEVVQEQMEQFSDSTYKVPCSKFSTQTITGGPIGHMGKRSTENLISNSSHKDWLHNSMKESSRLCLPKAHGMRSRRTRINKIKSGWKKAFVQTVRDGTRNERVGVIVMGSKGPEFYSKNSTPQLSYKKSKILLDNREPNFEVMAVDCKNVFLSSSEPAPRTAFTGNPLVCPEEGVKVEDSIAKFSKNIDDVVKSSEQKFYKSLTSMEYPTKKDVKEDVFKAGGDGLNEQEVKKEKTDAMDSSFPSFHLLPFEKLSPRVPKSLRKGETKISEDSKTRADALNETAKQYKENSSSLQDREETFLEELKELQEKYPPSKEAKPKAAETDLSFWDLNLEITEKEEKNEEECKNDEIKTMENEKTPKDETNQKSGKSTERIGINKQRRKKYYESGTTDAKAVDDVNAEIKLPAEDLTPKTSKRTGKPKNSWEQSNASFEEIKQPEDTDPSVISAVFRDLVENGCAISQEESENLQNTFNRVSYNEDLFRNDVMSSTSSEVTNLRDSKANDSQRTPKNCTDAENKEKSRKGCEKEKKKETPVEDDSYMKEINCKKVSKTRKDISDAKESKKVEGKTKDGKKKKKIVIEDKMRLLRKALPSIAAQNEAAHLKQLKKYIDRFIDRVEASASSEFGKRREVYLKSKESTSTECSEVRVDARKILDFVSNPFKRISSDVTINIAKKLTDALVQDRCHKSGKNQSETEGEGLVSCGDSSGSELCEEPEPTYLKQLKRMRNEHLNNIVLEVKRLSELLRFLDRCNRLHS